MADFPQLKLPSYREDDSPSFPKAVEGLSLARFDFCQSPQSDTKMLIIDSAVTSGAVPFDSWLAFLWRIAQLRKTTAFYFQKQQMK